MNKIIYKGFCIFFFQENYSKIGKKLIDKDYTIVKIIKNTQRNYVALIEIDKKKYVYKEPRNEFRIPQRKFMSLFKRGEALSTLKNIHYLIYNENIDNFADIYIAINKRKLGMISESMILMEYIDGRIDYDFRDKEVALLKDIHKRRFYHGDFNPGNFLIKKDGSIKIIDTQGKKMYFGRYRAHYDMLTMKMDSYSEMLYPYNRDIWYYLALTVKKIKKFKYIDRIKKFKKKLRDKGWRI